MLSNPPCCSVRIIHATFAEMLSRLTGKLNRFACGLSPPPEDEEEDDENVHAGAMLAAPFLRHRRTPRCYSNRSTTMNHPYRQLLSLHDDGEEVQKGTTATAKEEEESVRLRRGGVMEAAAVRGEDEEVRLPCLAFPSLDGYKVFSLAEKRVFDGGEVRMRMACRRRYVASPYGGKVFVTDFNWRYSSRLVDPFTGEVTPLPDLPLPLSETEPTPCADDEPRRSTAAGTDDAFAWDYSPRGAMVSRGDTAFFCEFAAAAASWAPVHRSRCESPMTVNYRGGFFFILERLSLRTTVIDADTLAPTASIAPPPSRHNIDDAYLVASTDDVLLLVRRRGDLTSNREVFNHAYRARRHHRKSSPSSSSPPEWEPVTDIGDRAAFITRSHGFTVGVGPGGEHAAAVQRNCVYVVTIGTERDDSGRVVVSHKIGVVRLRNLKLPPAPVPGLEGDVNSCLHERMLGMPHWIFRNDDDAPPPSYDDDGPPPLYDDGGLPPLYDDDGSPPSAEWVEEPESLCYFC